MRRKDNQPKTKALRHKALFKCGFSENDTVISFRAHEPKRPLGEEIRAISFFSGCGGMDLGFQGGFSFHKHWYESLPFKIVDAYDNLADAVECYRLNFGGQIHNADLTQIHQTDFPDAEVLMGGFPCQDFSSSGPKTGFDGKRGQLYKVLLNYMIAHKPKVVIGENVNYLAKLKNGDYLSTILTDFESAGYHFDVWELYAPDYGVPQSRRRLFLVGVRNDIAGYPVRPSPTTLNHPLTISQALCDLEAITDESIPNQSQYFVASRASGGGGQGDHTNDPDKVSYCIRANSRGRIQFHYRLDRRLTVRECARLQTFPDEFVFPFTTQRNLTLIGNAVPPVLGHFVARSIWRFLSGMNQTPNPDASMHPVFLRQKLCTKQTQMELPL